MTEIYTTQLDGAWVDVTPVGTQDPLDEKGNDGGTNIYMVHVMLHNAHRLMNIMSASVNILGPILSYYYHDSDGTPSPKHDLARPLGWPLQSQQQQRPRPQKQQQQLKRSLGQVYAPQAEVAVPKAEVVAPDRQRWRHHLDNVLKISKSIGNANQSHTCGWCYSAVPLYKTLFCGHVTFCLSCQQGYEKDVLVGKVCPCRGCLRSPATFAPIIPATPPTVGYTTPVSVFDKYRSEREWQKFAEEDMIRETVRVDMRAMGMIHKILGLDGTIETDGMCMWCADRAAVYRTSKCYHTVLCDAHLISYLESPFGTRCPQCLIEGVTMTACDPVVAAPGTKAIIVAMTSKIRFLYDEACIKPRFLTGKGTECSSCLVEEAVCVFKECRHVGFCQSCVSYYKEKVGKSPWGLFCVWQSCLSNCSALDALDGDGGIVTAIVASSSSPPLSPTDTRKRKHYEWWDGSDEEAEEEEEEEEEFDEEAYWEEFEAYTNRENEGDDEDEDDIMDIDDFVEPREA